MINPTTYLPNLLSLSALFFVACASPGPDFVNVVSHALGNRRSGSIAAPGAAVGCITWASLAIFGLSLLLARFRVLSETLKVLGAAYLIYIGARMLWSAKRNDSTLKFRSLSARAWRVFWRGLFTSLGNPKSAIFFGSLLVTVVPQGAPSSFYILTVLLIGVVSAGWYSAVAFFFSTSAIREMYGNIHRFVDVAVGVFFIFVGVRVWFLQ